MLSDNFRSIWWPRTILVALYGTYIILPRISQPALVSLYSTLYHSSFYQLSSFETIETVFFYALIEPAFTSTFAHHPELRLDNRFPEHDRTSDKPRLPKMRRPQHRILEIITYISPLLLMDFTMIKKFAGVPVSWIRESGNYLPLQSLPSANNSNISPSFLLPTFHNFTASSPLQTRRALPISPPTSRQLCLELTLAFIIYDFLFFLLHLALHRVPVLKRIHVAHHSHAEIHPQITNRLSVPERLSLVLLANFSLNIIGSHVLTRTLFVPIFVWLLVEIHSGLDLPWGYEKILPTGFGLGAREHALHHRCGEKGQGAYAPFFAWNDAALKWIESRWTRKKELD